MRQQAISSFSEEQVEVYCALGQHAARRFVHGLDEVAVAAADYDELIAAVDLLLPRVKELRAANRPDNR